MDDKVPPVRVSQAVSSSEVPKVRLTGCVRNVQASVPVLTRRLLRRGQRQTYGGVDQAERQQDFLTWLRRV